MLVVVVSVLFCFQPETWGSLRLDVLFPHLLSEPFLPRLVVLVVVVMVVVVLLKLSLPRTGVFTKHYRSWLFVEVCFICCFSPAPIRWLFALGYSFDQAYK